MSFTYSVTYSRGLLRGLAVWRAWFRGSVSGMVHYAVCCGEGFKVGSAGCVRSCRDAVMPGDACQEESCGDGKLGGHCPCVQLVEGACSRHHLDLSVTACYTMPGMHERIGQGPLCSWLVFGLLSSQDMAEVFAASCCLRSAKLWNGADGR